VTGTRVPPPKRRTRRLGRLAATIRQLDRAAPAAPGSAAAERIAALAAELRLPAPQGADEADALARIGAGFARLPPEVPAAIAALLLPILHPASRNADR
jgi:hypothetical protein